MRDRFGRPVACFLFGSAAWKCADSDAFIGWERATRERNLQHLTNNTRFLIPRWVRGLHLASHVLGLMVRHIRSDWQEKYGHPLHALETFVESSRFQGTCYRAANWQRLGETRGAPSKDNSPKTRTTATSPPQKPAPASQPPTGGQAGHAGHKLRMVEKPDRIVIHCVERCTACGQSLDNHPSRPHRAPPSPRTSRAQARNHRAPSRNQDVLMRLHQPRDLAARSSRLNIPAMARGVGKIHMIGGQIQHCLLLEIFTNAGIGTEIVPT